MADPDTKAADQADPAAVLVRRAAELMAGSGVVIKDLGEVNTIVETLQAADELRGARQERKEVRQFWLAIVGGTLFTAFVLLLIAMSNDTDRPKRIEQVLTAFLAAVPSAMAAYFFGQKSVKKE